LSPEIDSKESIPPAYVAWRAGIVELGCRFGPPCWESIPGLRKRFTNTGSGLNGIYLPLQLTDWLLVDVALLDHWSDQNLFVEIWF
jgi:hypothetical protein